ncbi:MAG: hypothetical protein ACJ760_13250 [Thermoleophilaceae bacterium]
MRRTACGGAALTAIVALAVAAAPAAASRADCLTKAHHARVLAENVRGILYSRSGRVSACSYRTGAAHALPGQGPGEIDPVEAHVGPLQGTWAVQLDSIRMAGTHVGYGLHWTETTTSHRPDTDSRVVSFDFRAGEITYQTTPAEAEGTRVASLVAKPNGSVAWIYSSASGVLVVKMDRESGGEERGLDSGNGFGEDYRIERRSLALSDDGTRIFWSTYSSANGPTTVHARLR